MAFKTLILGVAFLLGAGPAIAEPGAVAVPGSQAQLQKPFYTSIGSSTNYSGSGSPYNPISDFIYTEAFILQAYFASAELLADGDRWDAYTERHWMENYRRWIQTVGLVKDFENLRKEQFMVSRTISGLRDAGHYLDDLKVGTVHVRTWKALDYVTRTSVPADVLKEWYFKNVPAFDASNFYPNQGKVVQAFPGGKLIDFLEFMRQFGYGITFSSEAHFLILELLDAMYGHVVNSVKTMLARIDALHRETFASWKIDFAEHVSKPITNVAPPAMDNAPANRH